MILVQEGMMHDLATDEPILDIAPCARHHSILSSYLLNSHQGRYDILRMIIEDLHSFMDIGAIHRATDLAIVLQLFLLKHPNLGDADFCFEFAPKEQTSPEYAYPRKRMNGN